jgi:hypothetical protein
VWLNSYLFNLNFAAGDTSRLFSKHAYSESPLCVMLWNQRNLSKEQEQKDTIYYLFQKAISGMRELKGSKKEMEDEILFLFYCR